MLDQIKVASLSEDIKEKLLAGNDDMRKQASAAIGEYFKTKVRENGIRRQITPPEQITKARLDYSEQTDFPSFIVDIQPESAGAKKISFETGPHNEPIHARKTRVEFNRIITPKYSIDKARLINGYRMPLLDILYDLMLKDLMEVEDQIAIGVDDEICGTVNTNNTDIGCRRYTTAGAVSRAAVVHARKAMMSTPGNLMAKKYLMNQSTFVDFGVLDTTSIGDSLAQDSFINGVTWTKLGGIDVCVTIKKNIVPNNIMYVYSDPESYGGFYTFEDVSMITDERDGYWLSFFAYEMIAMSVVNAAGVAKVSFTGSVSDWENAA